MPQRISGTALLGPGVVTGHQYLDSRRIDALRAVKAVTQAQAEVLKRADSLVGANQDGVASYTELNALFTPEGNATLFPAERRALNQVWKKFELGAGAQRVVTAPAPTATVTAGQLGSVDTPLLIASLPDAATRRTARRLQLSSNADGNARTISLADIDQALSAARRHLSTAAELTALAQLRVTLARMVTSQATPPTAELSAHGRQVYAVERGAALTVEVVGTMSFARLHQGGRERDSSYFVRSNPSLSFVVPAGHRAIVVDEGQETVLDAGAHGVEVTGPSAAVELYDGRGRRVEVLDFDLGGVAASTWLARDVPVGMRARTPSGALLVEGTTPAWPHPTMLSYTTAGAADALPVPTSPLPTGRYRVSDGAQTRDLVKYADGAFTVDGQWLSPQDDGTYRRYDDGGSFNTSQSIAFDPRTGVLSISVGHFGFRAVVTEDARVVP